MRFTSIDEVVRLFEKWGDVNYAEVITQTEHAVQCAVLAESDGAPSHLVVAALLHDIGHLVDLEMNDGIEVLERDTSHEASGARSIADILPASVRLPIALHVEAKRWLCAREDGYLDALSPASAHSLRLQGGPMTDEETLRFERMPGFADAVALRRWDDLGKDDAKSGDISDLVRILRGHAGTLRD